MKTAIDLVVEQARDSGIWFVAQTITEAYLQSELRKLHAAVEQDFYNECGKSFPKDTQ